MKKTASKQRVMRIVYTLLALLTTPTMAQTMTDFSGTWKRNDAKTVVTDMSINSIPVTLEIQQTPSNFLIKRTSRNGNGEYTNYTEALNLDGSAAITTTPSKFKKSSTITWSPDKQNIIETSLSKSDDGVVRQSAMQSMMLKDGGKTLEILLTGNSMTKHIIW